MTTEETPTAPERSKPDSCPTQRLHTLRIWPAIVLLFGMALFRALPSLLKNGPAMIWMSSAFGPALCGVFVLIWWVSFSRASGKEKLRGFFGVILALTATIFTVHPSLHGPIILVLTIPMGMAAFSIGALIGRQWLTVKRTHLALSLTVVAFSLSLLLKNEGMWGNFDPQLSWRWTPTAEDTLLAQQKETASDASNNATAAQIELPAKAEWPGFRGPDRNSRQKGVRFTTVWNTSPPKELWRIAVGPGWSSFVVAGNYLFTQEQRGEQEAVVCYDAGTGKEIWTQSIKARFFDPLGGAGPRATPTLADGKLFVTGANGDLLRLDPGDGNVVWRTNIHEVSGREAMPMWGYSSSPLVVNEHVIVYAGGKDDKGTLAFHVDTGKLRWSAPAGEQSYASPQFASIGNVGFVMTTSDFGLRLLNAAHGTAELSYEWPHKGYRALQPQAVGDGRIIIPTGLGTGTRLIRVGREDGNFVTEDLWTSLQLKPDFNDFVVYQQHIYGFDGGIFTCIDLETGTRQWKGGRYGKGQVLLLADSGLLLVLSERGKAVLLEATPRDHKEVASLQMLKGKTWNHPVVVGNRLYVRNATEAACYELPTVTAPPTNDE